jgi:hypothetical protein
MNQPTANERRKFARRNLSYYLPIMDSNTQQIIGHLVDISPIGIMIDCKRNIPSSQSFNLRLDLMEKIGGKASVEFVARCRWCRADKIQPYLYNAGFEIVSISTEGVEIIKNIAERYGESR